VSFFLTRIIPSSSITLLSLYCLQVPTNVVVNDDNEEIIDDDDDDDSEECDDDDDSEECDDDDDSEECDDDDDCEEVMMMMMMDYSIQYKSSIQHNKIQ